MRSVEAGWAELQRPGAMADARPRPSRAVLTAALTALLVLAAAAVVVTRLAGLQPLTVLTGSMQPTFGPGDLVLASRQTGAELRVGQVVTFASPDGREGRTLTHRVTAVRPAADDRVQVTTKGDANPVGETWTMPRAGDVGLVRAVLPHAGRLLHPIGAGWTRGVLLAVLTLAGSAVALWVIWRPEGGRP